MNICVFYQIKIADQHNKKGTWQDFQDLYTEEDIASYVFAYYESNILHHTIQDINEFIPSVWIETMELKGKKIHVTLSEHKPLTDAELQPEDPQDAYKVVSKNLCFDVEMIAKNLFNQTDPMIDDFTHETSDIRFDEVRVYENENMNSCVLTLSMNK